MFFSSRQSVYGKSETIRLETEFQICSFSKVNVLTKYCFDVDSIVSNVHPSIWIIFSDWLHNSLPFVQSIFWYALCHHLLSQFLCINPLYPPLSLFLSFYRWRDQRLSYATITFISARWTSGLLTAAGILTSSLVHEDIFKSSAVPEFT